MNLSPAQRHREGCFRLASERTGLHQPPCYFEEEGDCRGRLQAAHVISAQSIKRMYSQARIIEERTGERRAILEADLDDLIADHRNGVVSCERHHHMHEGPVLHAPTYPAELYAFTFDYGLDYLISGADPLGQAA